MMIQGLGPSLWRRVFGFLEDRWGLLMQVCRTWRQFLLPFTVRPNTKIAVGFESLELLLFLDATSWTRYQVFPLKAVDRSPFEDKVLLLDLSLSLRCFLPSQIRNAVNQVESFRPPLRHSTIAHWYWNHDWLKIHNTEFLAHALLEDPNPLKTLEERNFKLDPKNPIIFHQFEDLMSTLAIKLDRPDQPELQFNFPLLPISSFLCYVRWADKIIASSELSVQRKCQWLFWLRDHSSAGYPLWWHRYSLETQVLEHVSDPDDAFCLLQCLSQLKVIPNHFDLFPQRLPWLIGRAAQCYRGRIDPLEDSILTRLIDYRLRVEVTPTIDDEDFWRHQMADLNCDLFLHLHQMLASNSAPFSRELTDQHLQTLVMDCHSAARLWTWMQYFSTPSLHIPLDYQLTMGQMAIKQWHLPLLCWLTTETKFPLKLDTQPHLIRLLCETLDHVIDSCPEKQCLEFTRWCLSQDFGPLLFPSLVWVPRKFIWYGQLEDVQWICQRVPQFPQLEYFIFYDTPISWLKPESEEEILALWEWWWSCSSSKPPRFTLTLHQQREITASVLPRWDLLRWLRSHGFAWSTRTRSLALSRSFIDPFPSSRTKKHTHSSSEKIIYRTRAIKRSRLDVI